MIFFNHVMTINYKLLLNHKDILKYEIHITDDLHTSVYTQSVMNLGVKFLVYFFPDAAERR